MKILLTALLASLFLFSSCSMFKKGCCKKDYDKKSKHCKLKKKGHKKHGHEKHHKSHGEMKMEESAN